MNKKQQRFVAEYLIDQNGTRAYKAAYGPCSDNVAAVGASKLLRQVKIREAVEFGLREINDQILKRRKDALLTKERWIEEITAMSYADPLEFFSEQNGKLSLSTADIRARGMGRLIRKMTVLQGGKLQFELHSKLQALEILGKHNGWLKDHVEHSGAIGSRLTEQQFTAAHSTPEAAAAALALAESLCPPPPKRAKGTE